MLGLLIFFFLAFCFAMFVTFSILGSKEEDPKKKSDYGIASGVFGVIVFFCIVVGFFLFFKHGGSV